MTITNEAVEAAAKVCFDAAVRTRWEDMPSDLRAVWLREARAALEAAYPYMLTGHVEPQKVAP